MAEVHVKGLAELQKVLDTLPAKLEKNVMRGALRAGANVIRTEAQTLVPVRTGALRRSLRVGTNSRGGVVTARVRTNLFYAKFVEYGAAAHAIVASVRAALSFGSTVVRSVDHPGARPRPFLRPALDNKASAAVIAAAEYMKARLASKHGIDTAHIKIEGDE